MPPLTPPQHGGARSGLMLSTLMETTVWVRSDRNGR